MHHFKAKGGTHFNFNSDMSGDVRMHREPDDAIGSIPGADLLEFARWCVALSAGVSSEPTASEAYEITVDVEGAWEVNPVDRSYPRKEARGNILHEPATARRCAEAVLAVLEGRDETVGTVEIPGQTDWLWMVTDPSPVSELGDILFQPGDRLRDWCIGCAASKGGVPAATLYADEGAARVDAMGRLVIRDAASELRRVLALMGSSVIDGESRARINAAIDEMGGPGPVTPAESPTRRPVRDVAHDIMNKSWWHPCPAMSRVKAADVIVAIIRADRKGGA